MRRIAKTLTVMSLVLLTIGVTAPVAAKPNALQCGPYSQQGVCSSAFNAGALVLIHPGIAFVWLRNSPRSFGHVVNTVWPGSGPVLQIMTGMPSWDGYQNWFYVSPIGQLYSGGWVEQASLQAMADPYLPPNASAGWPVPIQATLKAGVRFAWVRAQPSSYAGTLATLYPGSIFTVTNNKAAVFDSVQWWWPVYFTYPDGTSTIIVDGWLEQNSIVQVTPTVITPIVLPTPITPGSTAVSFTSWAAYQSFEYGFMIWTAWDQTIYIFTYGNGGVFDYVALGGYNRQPDNPVNDPIPAGKVKPIRGFGKVWGNDYYFRLALGWGVASELGYTATITPIKSATYGRSLMSQITIPDGRTVNIYGRFWHF